MATKSRCTWCQSHDIYIDYHDKEWGIPCYDSRELFENLCLEGAQAGLSWLTILNKRENYRRLFAEFDPVKMARFTDARQAKLLEDAGIVRNRLKVSAFVTNAKSYLKMQQDGEDFAEFIWSFVDHRPQQNHLASMQDCPSSTSISDAMSKALKKKGFKFVGSTICYAFMQASGLVNDHTLDCFRHAPTQRKAASRYMPPGWPGKARGR